MAAYSLSIPRSESEACFKLCDGKSWLRGRGLSYAPRCVDQELSIDSAAQDLTLASAHEIAMAILNDAERARAEFFSSEALTGLAAEYFK
jgi:hypothetical protein